MARVSRIVQPIGLALILAPAARAADPAKAPAVELPRNLAAPRLRIDTALVDSALTRLSRGRGEAARLLGKLGFKPAAIAELENADELSGERMRMNLDADDAEESIVELRASATEKNQPNSEERRVSRYFYAWLDPRGDSAEVVGTLLLESSSPLESEAGCSVNLTQVHAEEISDTLIECSELKPGAPPTKSWHASLVTLERGRAELIFESRESVALPRWDKQERAFVVAGKAPREIRLVVGKGKAVKRRHLFDAKAFRYR